MIEQQDQTAPQDPATPQVAGRRPRTGPIVWGALILVFCAFYAQRTFAPATVDATTWAIASVIGLGVLLLVVGVVVAIRARR